MENTHANALLWWTSHPSMNLTDLLVTYANEVAKSPAPAASDTEEYLPLDEF